MEFIGYIKGLARDEETDRYQVTIQIDEECKTAFGEIKDNYNQGQKLKITIAKWYKKRSLNANDYMWALLDKIANCKDIRISKNEVYEQMLQSYGTLKYNGDELSKIQVPRDTDISGKPGHWMYNRLVELYDEFDRAVQFDEYIEIKGSSEYNTEEMACLLDGIIFEAKELGIETAPDADYQKMLEEWGTQYAKTQKHNNR